jgi:hypothetical protein
MQFWRFDVSVPGSVATLKANPETGLTPAEVVTRPKENGFNEMAQKKGRLVLKSCVDPTAIA